MNPEQRQQAKDAWAAMDAEAKRSVREAGKAKLSVDDKRVRHVGDVERVERAVSRPAEPGVFRDARRATFGPPHEAPKPPGVAVAEEAWAKSKEARVWYLYKRRGMSQGDIAAAEKMTTSAVKQAVFKAEKAVAKLEVAPGWVSTDMLLLAIESAHATKQLAEWSEEEMLPDERDLTYAELSYSLDHPEVMGAPAEDDGDEPFADSEFE